VPIIKSEEMVSGILVLARSRSELSESMRWYISQFRTNPKNRDTNNSPDMIIILRTFALLRVFIIFFLIEIV
jgi:hypothetical protein